MKNFNTLETILNTKKCSDAELSQMETFLGGDWGGDQEEETINNFLLLAVKDIHAGKTATAVAMAATAWINN